MNNLRTLSTLGLLATALAASAQVTYSFVGTSSNVTFTLVTSTYVASTTTFQRSAFQTSTGTFDSATLYPVSPFSSSISEIDVNAGLSAIYGFASGALGRNGVYGSTGNSNVGTLTVTGGPTPAPEPSALAALGLGAVAFVKRRKRA